METIYYVHARRKPKGAFILARLRGGEAEFLIPPDYPEALIERAIDAFGYMLGCVLWTSEFEWWALEDELPADVAKAIGAKAEELGALVRRAWSEYDLSRPHGSPLGRAGGVEPPAPAAD